MLVELALDQLEELHHRGIALFLREDALQAREQLVGPTAVVAMVEEVRR